MTPHRCEASVPKPAMYPFRWTWAIALALAAGSASAADVDAPPPQPPASAARTGDEAVDASGQPMDVAARAARWRSARYVLLGEVHDNPEHHRLRAELLRALLSDGMPTWVVFEQIDRQHNAAVGVAPRDADAVVAAGQLDRAAWGWPLHRPLFDAALAGGATVVGGNLGRADASRVVRGGLAQAPADLRRFLADPRGQPSEAPVLWTARQNAELVRQIDEGHCGALPLKMMAPMALAQRARDAALASAMVEAPPGTRVVLIAGNGHVRRDIGVPHYLATQTGGVVVSIGFLERAEDGSTVVDGPYDEAWFTPRVAREDPCAGFRPASEPDKPG